MISRLARAYACRPSALLGADQDIERAWLDLMVDARCYFAEQRIRGDVLRRMNRRKVPIFITLDAGEV